MTIVQDSFNRAAAGGLGSPWVGSTPNSWDTDGSKAVAQSTDGNAYLLLASAEHQIKAKWTSQSGTYCGVVFRLQTTTFDNCYDMLYWGPNSFYRLRKTVSGSTTNLMNFTPGDPSNTEVIVRVYGSSATRIALWINGSLADTPYIDSSSPITTGNYVAISQSGAGGASFDDLDARDLSEGWFLMAKVSKSGAGTTSGSLFDSFGSNLIVAGCATFASGGFAFSDSKSNSWTALTRRTDGVTNSTQHYYCLNPSVGTAHTFTWNGTLEGNDVTAWRGAKSSSVVDQESGTTSGTQPGSLTPSVNGCLIFTSVAGGTDTSAPTIDSGFTIVGNRAFVTSVNLNSGAAFLVQDSAAAINPAWSDSGCVAMTVFLPPATASATSFPFSKPYRHRSILRR